jgi:mannose-6-phosphate isomerase-like protein (cupin superfamily)
MSVAGDTQEVREGDLILVPPATDHSIANEGDSELACISVQSPPVSVAELYGNQMAEVTGYEDDEEL